MDFMTYKILLNPQDNQVFIEFFFLVIKSKRDEYISRNVSDVIAQRDAILCRKAGALQYSRVKEI